MKDFEDQLKQWRGLEILALAAEERLKGMQGANTPELAALAGEATDKRQRADAALDALLRSRAEPPG